MASSIGYNPSRWGTSTPATTSEQKGFHSESHLQLRDKKYTSRLSADSFIKLSRVTAPEVRSGSFCEVDNCEIRSIQADSFIKVHHSNVESIKSDSFIELEGVGNLSVAKADSFIKANQLENSEKTKLISDSFIELKRSQVYSLKADSYVKAHEAMASLVKSSSFVQASDATLDEVEAFRFEGERTAIVSLVVEGDVVLNTCKVLHKIVGNDIIAKECEVLGAISATESISVSSCPSIGSLSAVDVTLSGCKVEGDITAQKVKIMGSTVRGNITTKAMETTFTNSRIKTLIVEEAPPAKLMGGKVVSDEIDSKIAPLVEAMQSGSLTITPKGSGFHLDFRSQGRGFGSCRTVINDISISASTGISFSNRGLRVGDMVLPTDKKIIRAALEFMEEANRPEVDSISDAEPKPQVVIVNGGHIDEIHFKGALGGVVIKKNNATVGSIINEASATVIGQQKEVAEPPEHFLDPVYYDVMLRPYKTPSKQVFNYETLVRLASKDENKTIICPLTRIKYSLNNCILDVDLQKKIQTWLKTHKPA